jgi:hypothetical protein
MLKCVPISDASKLGPIATTYRSKLYNPYGSCPTSCPLLPKNKEGTQTLDEKYTEAVLKAVPRKGLSFTYTHFPLAQIQNLLPTPPIRGTTINISTDTVEAALEAQGQGWPTVFAAPLNWPHRLPAKLGPKPVRFIKCPAPLVTCATCGGGDPLCFRKNRDYVIVFPAHGSLKHLVGQNSPGGCYASTGNTITQWTKGSQGIGRVIYQDHEEIEGLTAWVASLPARSTIRHHIAGDLGQ